MSLIKNAHLLNLQNYSCQNAYLVKTQKDIAKIYDILNADYPIFTP